jgi:hypothetical protein
MPKERLGAQTFWMNPCVSQELITFKAINV